MTCICGRQETTIQRCCGDVIAGRRPAATAEELMRSRYVAYVQENISYLAATQDPAREFDARSASAWAARARWQGLSVVDVSGGGVNDQEGEVEFVARYSLDGEPGVHHERSRFRKVSGRWLYLEGAQPPAKRATTVGRNTRCPCGSGKKYKRCCGP